MASTEAICSFCKKTGAKMKCIPCRDVGLLITYCTKDCQAKHWKSHKKICAYSNKKDNAESKDNTKKPDLKSNGNTNNPKSEEKGRKAFKKIFSKTVGCQQCFKTAGEGVKLLLCAKCQTVHYCSRECQVLHWKKHKSTCKNNSASHALAVEHGMSNEHELLEQWKTESAYVMVLASASVLTMSQMKEQPPSFVTVMDVNFNFNLKTFLFTKKPSTVSIRDLPENFIKTGIYQQMKKDEDWRSGGGHDGNCLHYALLLCNSMASIKPLVFPIRSRPWDDCVNLSKQIALKSRLFEKWAVPFQVNWNSQLQVLRRTEEYTGFLYNAFHVLSKTPRHKTHAIVIDFEFGFGLGQVGALNSYEALPLEDVRNMLRAHPEMSEAERRNVLDNMLDVENSPTLIKSRAARPKNVLLPVVFRHVAQKQHMLFMPNMGEILLGGQHFESVKNCDQVADENFRRLQLRALSLPEVVSPALH